MKHRRHALLLACLCCAGSSASSQLDLPRGSKPRPSPPTEPAPELVPLPAPKGDLAPRGDGVTPLDLPWGAGPPPSVGEVPQPPAGPDDAARFIFEHLERAREPHLADAAVESLATLGEAGLRAARVELATTRPIPLLAAGRLLIRAGSADDRRAVADRLTRAVPPEVPGRLLPELIARDPVLASPAYLVSLLEHETSAMRSAARESLASRLDPALLPFLAERLDSPRTPTRLAALELVGAIRDRSSWNLLASRLGDKNAQVASSAARILASVSDAEIEPFLVERAFGTDLSWDRGRAYALLALAARETANERVLLEPERIPSLLEALGSPEPIVSGAAAVALARIGFRCPASPETAWLDLEVPHALVRTGTGAEFHADFSSLQRPALGALALISGKSFGESGEAWRRWWTESAGSFRARRAVIEVGADDFERLRIDHELPGREVWVVLGPRADRSGATGNLLYLGADEAERLTGVLRAEGIFGVERPPARTGTAVGAGRRLVITIAGQVKELLLAPAEGPDWQQRLERELASLRERNRWQFLYDRARYASQQAWWQAEHERWSELSAADRARETKRLLLAALERETPAGGAPYLEELALLYRESGVPEAEDFAPLLACLRREKTFGARAKTLFQLARAAATLADPAGDGSSSGAIDPSLGELLWSAGVALPGEDAALELERLLPALGPEHARAAARDARASARACVVRWLARSSEPEDRALVLELLEDPDQGVRLAATEALAALGTPEARERLVALARESPPAVRAAALGGLRTLGPLAGEEDERKDLALLALADPDPVVQEAGVALLADLADPGSASLLCALIARGRETVFFEEARAGLLRLGEVAEEECLRLARSTNARTRREATLLLAQMGRASAAPLLLTLLAEDPADLNVESELAILSGLDLAAEVDPVSAGWRWWDLVVHDDPLVWLFAAAEREGIAAPPAEALRARTPEGTRFLLALVDLERSHLVERALRELEKMLGRPLDRPSSDAAARAVWRAELEELVLGEDER